MKTAGKSSVFFAFLGILAGTSALAADDIYLGQPSYGGTGCPGGTVGATLSPDAKTLSILFDGFVTEAGGTTRKRMDRKNCQVAIPVHVPQGYSFSIIEIDYRGFNSLPSGAQSTFNVEYFLAYPGSPTRGPRYSKNFYGPLNEDYVLSNVLGLEAVVWSPCGTDVNLRTAASLMVQTNRRQEQAMATLDSMDVKAGILYQIQWRRCN